MAILKKSDLSFVGRWTALPVRKPRKGYRRDAIIYCRSSLHERKLGLPCEIENSARSPLPRTTAIIRNPHPVIVEPAIQMSDGHG